MISNVSAHARMAARSGGKLLYEALATEKNRGKLPGLEASDSFRSDPPGRRGLVPGLDLQQPLVQPTASTHLQS